MGTLPTLNAEHPGRVVLDASAQAVPVLIGLARAWCEDPEGITALLGDLADLDAGRAGAHPGELEDIEHARDGVARQLLTEAGGADFHLRAERDRLAAHQARRVAEEARRMADALDAHAHRITVKVEEADDRRAVQRDAELVALRAQLGHSTVGATPAYQANRPT